MNLSKENIKKIILILFSVILFYWVLTNYKTLFVIIRYIVGIISPFILGLTLAFILNVPMRAVERHMFPKAEGKIAKGIRRPVSFIITLLLIFVLFDLAMEIIAPDVAATVKDVAKRVPGATDHLIEQAKKAVDSWPVVQEYIDKIDFDWQVIIQKVIGWAQSGAIGIVNTGIVVIGSVISGTVSFIVGIIFAIYVLFQKEKLARQLKEVLYVHLNEKTADKVVYIASLSQRTFSNFLSGQCIEAVVLGTLFFITLSILKIPYALLIGVIIAFTALIPIVGAFIGLVIGALLILMVNPMQALIFIITFFVLQQIEGNVIYPKVVGNSVGLPSIWVLVAVTVGGSLMGVLGMLVFIPLCSVLYSLYRQYIRKKLIEKKVKKEKYALAYMLPEDILEEKEKEEKKKARKEKMANKIKEQEKNKK